MNKAILMSIQPVWLAKILNGEKTIEIRKTMPKCELPIDVYLYCTKEKPYITQQSNHQFTIRDTKDYTNLVNGKVVAKFTLNKVDTVEIGDDGCVVLVNGEQSCLPKGSCLTDDEWFDYVGYGDDFSLFDSQYDKAYAWHIDNLVIFNKPKELSEFYKARYFPNKITDAYEKVFGDLTKYRLTKAPQSWQYVYVKGEKNEI